jgi:2-polyprenyl-3-methyl-5-hydroxy-6-metoxy-1,4-benzoquinol methylase
MMKASRDLPDIRVPPELDPADMPDLLRYWYLGSKARRHMMLRRFREVDAEIHAPPGSRILDIGSAWGFHVLALRRLGFRVFGLDLIVDQFPVGQAIAGFNSIEFPVLGGDAAALPFGGGSFDCVTMVETMEHIYSTDRPAALSECRRVLRNGGRLILSTPNYQSLVERYKRFAVRHAWLRDRMPAMCYPAGRVDRGNYHPYRYHVPSPDQEIRRQLVAAGFQVIKEKRFLFVLKNTSDLLFRPALAVETLLEKLPLTDHLAATVCFVAEK